MPFISNKQLCNVSLREKARIFRFADGSPPPEMYDAYVKAQRFPVPLSTLRVGGQSWELDDPAIIHFPVQNIVALVCAEDLTEDDIRSMFLRLNTADDGGRVVPCFDAKTWTPHMNCLNHRSIPPVPPALPPLQLRPIQSLPNLLPPACNPPPSPNADVVEPPGQLALAPQDITQGPLDMRTLPNPNTLQHPHDLDHLDLDMIDESLHDALLDADDAHPCDASATSFPMGTVGPPYCPLSYQPAHDCAAHASHALSDMLQTLPHVARPRKAAPPPVALLQLGQVTSTPCTSHPGGLCVTLTLLPRI